MTKTIYLANPYGFSAQQRARLLPELVHVLESLGAEVWEPFQRNSQVDYAMPGWAYAIGQRDLHDVMACDAIFAIVNGTPPDEGVMVELGIAIACRKQIFLFRDDVRRCTDSDAYPLNLMLFTGLPEVGWEEYYYTAIEDIRSPQKALVKWLSGVF
jgi:nucleoside 2-deoxyribosyltransferase